jgi:hypothetical protein
MKLLPFLPPHHPHRHHLLKSRKSNSCTSQTCCQGSSSLPFAKTVAKPKASSQIQGDLYIGREDDDACHNRREIT